MAADFRCEKCGQVLSIEAEPGSSLKCPNCKKKLTVPAALASLPRPKLPPGFRAPAGARAQAPLADEQSQEPATHTVDPVMALFESAMPWVASVVFHISIAVLMTLGVLIAKAEPIERPTPEKSKSKSRLSLELADATQGPLDNRPDRRQTYSQRESAIPADKGDTDSDVRLFRAANRAGGVNIGRHDIGGGKFFGEGAGGPGGGNMHHIVFVVDRSGSMVGIFPDVANEILGFIRKLREPQTFHIILFGEDRALEMPPGKMVLANGTHKREAVKFLHSDEITPGNNTTVLPALKRAFAELAKADTSRGREGKLIFLLTDGDFTGIGGSSTYKDSSGKVLYADDAVKAWLEHYNKDKEIHIKTFLTSVETRPKEIDTATAVLKEIAEKNGGKFVHISDEW